MRAWLALLVVVAAPSWAGAAPVFYFTGPYKSLADSPFNTSGLGSTFFLEDFEDGVFDLPGLSVFGSAEVLVPGSGTQSVESGGRSLKTTNSYDLLMKPPVVLSGLTFSFDSQALGFLPSQFGFALTGTDTPAGSQLWIRAHGHDGELVGEAIGSLDAFGPQAFIGVASSGGLAKVEFDLYASGARFSRWITCSLAFPSPMPWLCC